MSYTLAQATTEVRRLINEETADFWSDTEIQAWLKQGTIQIATKLLSAESEDTITLDGTTPQWVYSSSDETWIGNLLKINHAYYTDGSGNVYALQRITPEMLGHTKEFQTTGRPKYYFEKNHKVYFWPIPGSDENANDVTCLNSYETDDITALRDEHQPLVFYFAAAQAKMKELQFQEAALLHSHFINSINFERQDKHDIPAESVNEMNVP